jgi:AAA ATPase domain
MTPPTPSHFIGRRAELEALTTWLASTDAKPILISGMGGIGKTALVRRLVDDHYSAAKVAWLAFHAERDAAAALDNLYHRILREPPKLIVLDDIDHAVLDSIVSFLAKVQHLYPSLPIILTSRYGVNVIDAYSLTLASLSAEDAVALNFLAAIPLRFKSHRA